MSVRECVRAHVNMNVFYPVLCSFLLEVVTLYCHKYSSLRTAVSVADALLSRSCCVVHIVSYCNTFMIDCCTVSSCYISFIQTTWAPVSADHALVSRLTGIG